MKIRFDEPSHTYWLGKRELISVTTLIGSLKPEFDAQTHSKRVAACEGVSQRSILDQWDKKRDDACDRGHRLHEAIRLSLDGKEPTTVVPETFHAWRRWWMNASANLKPLMVEKIVYDEELGVAGTLDALFESTKTGLDHVFDWKQNKVIRTRNQYGEKLLPPFQDLDNCELITYSMQLSLYRAMLERQRVADLGDGWIIHLGTEAKAYKAKDYRGRLVRWIEKGLK